MFTAAGHPGFPQDSDLLEKNKFYSNNFNPYLPSSDIDPTVPMPVGTGMWIAGGNNNVIRNNWFWDNWRRGTMLFAVPDVFVCSPPTPSIPGCLPTNQDTSHRNQFYGNKMGVTPKGKRRPNGLDFWWDPFGQRQQLLVPEHRQERRRRQRHLATEEPPGGLRHEHWDGIDGRAEHRAARLRGRAPGRPGCPWFATPPKPSG